MNNAINMLPCPMCGCSSINVKNEQPTDNSGGYFIECPDCGISTSLRYACGDDPIPLLAEQWNRRATTQCLHQIAEPAAISEGEAFQALSELTNALRERHYGRMPSEVQAAYDKAWTIVFAGEKRAPVTQQAPAHPDDAAVDALAALMKAKLTEKRAKGYGGWYDKTQCPQQRLSDMLRAHVDKGDPVDVANFCAMLSARGEGIAAAPQAV
ncbi:Lar family restriction alleviation protein, partial [Comamonas aquatica]|uniref:Lar family restriction alleviation protein n=1 Tax=Comamonas aquatica TaxID=225991 RepID=UPI00244C695D